jgi:hypothetical protein
LHFLFSYREIFPHVFLLILHKPLRKSFVVVLVVVSVIRRVDNVSSAFLS